jgi:PAS domain S-box-containing protein
MRPEILESASLQATRPLRLLILEHTPDDVDLVLFALRDAGFSVTNTVATNKAQFLAALRDHSFDAILSDYRLPGWTGLDALKELRASGIDTPFLLVTRTLGEEAAVECMKQGVNDYILKDHLSRLPVALQRAIQEKALRDEAARSSAALKQSEARVREQFAELDLLYRTAPICVAILDRDLRYLRVNDAMAGQNGIPASQHIGRTLYEVAPQTAPELAACLHRVFATGAPLQNVQLRAVHPSHSSGCRDYLAGFYPLVTQENHVQSSCVILVDITDHKRAEEKLRRSEARNQELVESSIYGIAHISPEGAFLDSNPALVRMLGANSSADLGSMNLFNDAFRFPEQAARLAASCRDRKQVVGAEAEWRRRDGGVVTVRLHLRYVTLPGESDFMEVIAEDVTELRAMERQLRQSQKFEAIGQLAGGIAHDFNNVVGAILGWAELGYEQNRNNPQVADRFSRIREQADRAAALTRELLAFARRQVLQPRAVDLNEVTSGLGSFLDRVIGDNIVFKVVTAPLDPIQADPTQIEQVLMNLCINARDAMPQGGRLLVETEMVELDDSYCRFYPGITPGRYAVLSVSDTGAGMDAETRERIFEPFFTTKENGKGAGIGLATVYGIVKQHGGFIHVYSEPGQGSLFRVYLPAIENASPESAERKVLVPSLQEMRGSETILLAEDHEPIREMARQTLVSLGYRVLSASDGEEALRLCHDDVPALAILDVIMPRLGGPAAAAKLQTLFDRLPVLFTSGYSQDSEALSSTSPANYLQKPYSPTTLGRIVREILDRAAQARVSSI